MRTVSRDGLFRERLGDGIHLVPIEDPLSIYDIGAFRRIVAVYAGDVFRTIYIPQYSVETEPSTDDFHLGGALGQFRVVSFNIKKEETKQ